VKKAKEDYEETVNDAAAAGGTLLRRLWRLVRRAARAEPAFPGAALRGLAPVRRHAPIGREAGWQGGGRRPAAIGAAPAFEAATPINEDAGREPELAAGRPPAILGLIHECSSLLERVPYYLVPTAHNMRK